jgi:hypothetical protein
MAVQPSPGDKIPDAPSPPPDRPNNLIDLLSEVSRTREQTDNFNSIVDNLEPWALACFLLALAVIFLIVLGVFAIIFLPAKGIHGVEAPWVLGTSGLGITGSGIAVIVGFCRWIRRRRIRRRHAHRVSDGAKPTP